MSEEVDANTDAFDELEFVKRLDQGEFHDQLERVFKELSREQLEQVCDLLVSRPRRAF